MKVEGRRKQGRPRRKWMDYVREDLEEKQLRTEDAADRLRWKRMTTNCDPAWSGKSQKKTTTKKKKKKKMHQNGCMKISTKENIKVVSAFIK